MSVLPERVPRDYVAEMRALIDEATAEAPYTPPIVAGEIVRGLRFRDPELLYGWLDEQAEHSVLRAINQRDHSLRANARHRAGGKAFADAAAAADAGDYGPLEGFLHIPLTVEDGSRRPLGDLHSADLNYVAGTYEKRAAANEMMAVFLRALSRHIGDDAVSDHYTDEQLSAMFDSLR